VIEARNGADLVVSQYVWSGQAGEYLDELCEIRHNGDMVADPNFDASHQDHDWKLRSTGSILYESPAP